LSLNAQARSAGANLASSIARTGWKPAYGCLRRPQAHWALGIVG
jgi:hypothetical protein